MKIMKRVPEKKELIFGERRIEVAPIEKTLGTASEEALGNLAGWWGCSVS